MEYLSLGKIVDSFSLDGTLKVMSTTDNAKKRYMKGNKLFIVDSKKEIKKEITIISFRHNGLFDFVKCEEIQTPEDVAVFKGFEIQVIKNTKDLDKGYYYFSDLCGCQIIDQNNDILGEVKNVEEFPAQITLRVKRKNGKDFFVPFIKDFIINVDIENKKIYINCIEGML